MSIRNWVWWGFRETWSEKEFLAKLSDNISRVGKLRKCKYLLWKLPLHHRSILNKRIIFVVLGHSLCPKHQAGRCVAGFCGWLVQSQSRHPTDCGQPFLLSKENTGVFPPVLSKSVPKTCIGHSSPLVVKCSQHGKVILNYLYDDVKRIWNVTAGTLFLLVWFTKGLCEATAVERDCRQEHLIGVVLQGQFLEN